MLKPNKNLKKILGKIKLPKLHFAHFGEKMVDFLSSWWKVLLSIILGIVFLYYPLGGWLINKIDTTIDYEINTSNDKQSTTIEMASFLINREINDKIWTPNLPFFFPSHFLDNMPSFQLGVMEAIGKTINLMSNRLDRSIGKDEQMHLKEAAELLRYSGTIWMFSPSNPLLPAPSANTQYRKSRKQLIKFNHELAKGSVVFYKNQQDLTSFLQGINKDLNKCAATLENQIREESSSLYDNQADNRFYYCQGKSYAYFLLLKSLGYDYKDLIVSKNLYASWTRSLKALEHSSQISPFIIRNAQVDSSTAPNHLIGLGYYINKAININHSIINKLKENQ